MNSNCALFTCLATPLLAGGKLDFFSKQGDVTEIAAARELRGLANHRFDKSFVAGPTIAGNAPILNSAFHLYHVTEGKELSPKQGTDVC